MFSSRLIHWYRESPLHFHSWSMGIQGGQLHGTSHFDATLHFLFWHVKQTETEGIVYLNRVGQENYHSNILFFQSRKTISIPVNRTIIQQQRHWFLCEFIICFRRINKLDQNNCGALLKKHSLYIQPFPMCQYEECAHSSPFKCLLFDCQLINLRRDPEQRHRFSSNWSTTYHSPVLEIVMHILMGRMMRHWDLNNHFSQNAIFRLQDSSLIEVEYQFNTATQ
jgi:hypothetical protein